MHQSRRQDDNGAFELICVEESDESMAVRNSLRTSGENAVPVVVMILASCWLFWLISVCISMALTISS